MAICILRESVHTVSCTNCITWWQFVSYRSSDSAYSDHHHPAAQRQRKNWAEGFISGAGFSISLVSVTGFSISQRPPPFSSVPPKFQNPSTHFQKAPRPCVRVAKRTCWFFSRSQLFSKMSKYQNTFDISFDDSGRSRVGGRRCFRCLRNLGCQKTHGADELMLVGVVYSSN